MKSVIIKIILRYIVGMCCAYQAITDSMSVFNPVQGILAGTVMTFFLVYKFILHAQRSKPPGQFVWLNRLYWLNILLIPINHHFISSKALTHIIEGVLTIIVVIMAELLLDCLMEEHEEENKV